MATAVQRDRRMRVAEFQEWAAGMPDAERWELLDGVPVLMALPNEKHQAIVANLLALLRGPARKAGCRELPGLGIVNDAIDDYAPIPDIVVRCGPVGESGYASDPVLVIEVMSRSTMDDDRGRKSAYYKSIPSLTAYLVVYQDERRVEAWSRDDEGWSFQAFGKSDTISVPRPSANLPLSKIYDELPA